MKKLFSLVILLFTFVLTQAQDVPRTEYTVSVSERLVNLIPGDTKQITVAINKSKGFSKSKAKFGVSSFLPKGITISYEPSEGVVEKTVATITASKDVMEGEYQIILKSELRNITKGTIIKLVVTGSAVAKDAISAN